MDDERNPAERWDAEKQNCVSAFVCVCACLSTGATAKENRSGFHILASSIKHKHIKKTEDTFTC